MIKEAFEYLFGQADNAKRETVVEIHGKKYLFDKGQYRYIEPKRRQAYSHNFGSVDSLCRYFIETGKDITRAVITVCEKGIVADLNEDTQELPDILRVPFFKADMPQNSPMSHDSLLLYLDQHAGEITDEPLIRAGLSVVKAVQGQELTLRDCGASTRIEIKSTKGVEARTTDNQPCELPKYITINLRIGTREYSEPHRFRLKIGQDDGEITFRLVHLDRDGALDNFITRCIADIKERLPAACVLQGA